MEPSRGGSEGPLVGLTIVDGGWLLDQGGPLTLAIPRRVEIDATTVAPAIDLAA